MFVSPSFNVDTMDQLRRNVRSLGGGVQYHFETGKTTHVVAPFGTADPLAGLVEPPGDDVACVTVRRNRSCAKVIKVNRA